MFLIPFLKDLERQPGKSKNLCSHESMARHSGCKPSFHAIRRLVGYEQNSFSASCRPVSDLFQASGGLAAASLSKYDGYCHNYLSYPVFTANIHIEYSIISGMRILVEKKSPVLSFR